MSVKTAGVGHFTIPTAPAAGTSCTSGAANVFTTTYVQLIASTAAALYITGVHMESAAALAATYIVVQLATGGAGSETIIGQYLVPLSTASTVALGYRQIYPPIPVAISTRIACKTADSVGAKATLVTLECIAQSNVVDSGIAVGTVTTVTNQLTAAAIATGVWQDAVAGDFTTASSIGKALQITNVAPGAAGGHMISGSNAGTTTLGALTVTGATIYTGTTTHTGNVVLSDGLTISVPSTAGRAGLDVAGQGAGAGIKVTGGGTGIGLSVIGGGTSGDGVKITTTSGHGINSAPVGTNMHGFLSTGGNGGVSDGIKAAAGTGGVDFRANQTGNLTGTVATLTTYTGNTLQTGDSFAIVKSGGTGDNAAIKTKTDFLPSVAAGAAGGVFIAGSNAATTIATLDVSGATTLTGNVAAMNGIFIAGGTQLHALRLSAATAGHGLYSTGNTTGYGAVCEGGATGHGMKLVGGATSGSGLDVAGTGNSDGLHIVGNGSGNGMSAIAGATGTGIWGAGGATSGNGMVLIAQTAGSGIYVIGAGGGDGMTISGDTANFGSGITSSGYIGMRLQGTEGLHIQTNNTNERAVFIQGGGDNISGIIVTGGVQITGGTLGNALELVALAASGGNGISARGDGAGLDITAPNHDLGNAVWDVALAGHLGAGSTGAALNAAGDPWLTALPGAYAPGTAGAIIGTNLDALISSRVATSALNFTVPGYVDVNIQYVNDVLVTGNGQPGTEWGP